MKLTKSKEYQQMMKIKGKDLKNWNWQISAERTLSEIEEEKEYLSNVEEISHSVAAPREEKPVKIDNNPLFDESSTKECSEESLEYENYMLH